jgi:iron complex outermembrane receptor protein
VFWDVQDYVLQDIKNIEVVRGPGASLWGSNAVNGVINITTKKASETQGLYLSGLAGSEDRSAVARYGGALGDDWSYRVFGKYLQRDATFIARGNMSEDDFDLKHIGFRADRDVGTSSLITVQGELYDGEVGQIAPSVDIIGRPGPTGDLNVDVSGGNVLARWERKLDSGAALQLRGYYDRTRRDDPTFIDELDTIDLDLQYRFALPYSQDIVSGLSYRLQRNRNQSKALFNLDPDSSTDDVVSGFIQDQLTLTKALRLTLGTKLEHNSFSGFEVQPTSRLAWNFAENQTAWAAVSRAVRIPTRLERDIAIDVPSPSPDFDIRLLGNERFDAERLVAYELGYRWQITPQVAIDTAAFHNRYRGLASLEQGDPFIDQNGRAVIPIINRNLTDGEANGFEALAVFSPLRSWRITVNYSFVDLQLDPKGADVNRGRFFDGATPRHIYGIRSYLDLPAGFQIDAAFRRLSAVRRSPEIVDGSGIPGYGELDVKLAWNRNNSELALVGQNLLHRRHAEFGNTSTRGEIQRSAYLVLNFGF